MNHKELEDLPAGWQWVKLGEVCTIIGGGTPSRSNPEYFTGEIPWITPTDINKDQILVITESSQSITEIGLKESSARLLPIGTVLLTSRAGIGNVAIAGCELTTNQGFINFICGPSIDNQYLAHWLRANVDLLNARSM
jgi:type I restriction enzyme, S subunit